ncbi:MAG: molybdenum cofactor biosynthesis protein MoaE [Thermodesulfobacteriota bacterium]
MSLIQMINTLKAHPDYPRMGMIASHLGVVRETALDGRTVQGVQIKFADEIIHDIIRNAREMDGIIEALVETYEGDLKVGDEIMAVVVGGDTRDHVFPALIETVDAIKKNGAFKKELF